MTWHIGRSFTDTHIEDSCICPQENCGLISANKRNQKCEQHSLTKTIRQSHLANDCKGNDIHES